jgi:hypothetical protein
MPTHTPSSLEKFVMGDHDAPISVSVLVNARLAGYAYRTIPEDHILRENLRIPRRNLEIHHQLVKHQLVPLLKLWTDAGIKAMLIKGFWLAEFIYERPGDRGYGDVDVLVPEEQVQQAIKKAQDLGWKIVFNRITIGNTYSHEEANLTSNDDILTIDLHRYALQSIQSWGQLHPRRLTKVFWETAIQQSWQGTQVWLPTPVDGLILNLLNRARGDHWKRRISDLPDTTSITRLGISKEQLIARSSELNVQNTIITALETCNPWTNYIDSTVPNLWRRIVLYFKTSHEIGIYELETLNYKINLALETIYGLTIMLPTVFRVKQVLKRELDLGAIFQKLERFYPCKTKIDTIALIRSKRRGVKFALLILGPRENACVPRSLALFLTLRQNNIPVVFVSGVRRTKGKLEGHAWVEWLGRPLDGFGDHNAPQMFKENYRYPR